MAGFKTFVAGAVLTAADLNGYLMTQSVPVFTNEAARNAAITAPTKGMVAYLTASTVPAATGDTNTAVPTGITTIYNGAAWVCVTEVFGHTLTQGSTSSTSYTTTLASGGTNPTVTISTGTTAMITISCEHTNSLNTMSNRLSVSVSGATTLAASDNFCVFNNIITAGSQLCLNASFILTGLTAGSNTFAISYKTTGNTASYGNRRIIAKGVA